METSDKYSNGGIAWFALLVGIALGIGIGLFYTWEVDPVIERNTAPWQLEPQAKDDYVVAVALSYAYNHNLNLAFDRLRAASPNQDVWSMVAEVACRRHKTVQVKTNSDVVVMRALEQLYRPQGATGCADGQYPTPAPISFLTATPTITPTATLTPPATKTATPPISTSTPGATAGPTSTPLVTGSFALGGMDSFCDAAVGGMIEIQVFDINGEGVPGVPIEVRWGGNLTDKFYTGLKPGRGPGFADFQMVEGQSYTVIIPGLASPPPPVEAVSCEASTDTETVTTVTSYRINFVQQSE